MPWDYIDFPARSVRYDLSQYQRQSYEIKYWRGLDARAPQEAVRLTAHPEDGSPSFDIPCQYGWFPSYLDAEYYFVLEPTNGLAPPFDGDFELHLGAIRHSFSDMRFISTRDDHEGLLLCVYELRAGPDDSFKELAFDWLRRTSGA